MTSTDDPEVAPAVVDAVPVAPSPRAEPPVPTRRRRAWDRFVYLVWHQMILTEHPAWERFFARRCPHLAGMIAYFGVLSIIPAAFLFISALAVAGALENQGWIVEQLQFAIPEQGADTIVETVEGLRKNSGSLGVIGFIGLVWGTSNFFSCIESALNIIYGVNNRHFIFQKAWVLFLMFAALVAMTVGTLAVAVALPLLKAIDKQAEQTLHLPIQDSFVTMLVSAFVAFVFFLSCFRFLPNIAVSTREVWRGAVIAAVAFEASIQLLPQWVGADRGGVIISAFAGAFIVLIWFYVMAFFMLVGGCYNWWWREKRRLAAAGHPVGGA
ncbi:MAG: yihY [Thermoleophilia bacterium]|nr:yihY [Thermoleophilia bacterium]